MRACWHIAALLLLAQLAGCASNGRCPEPYCPAAPVALDCQPAQPQPLVPDVSLVANRQFLPAERRYCNLTEKDAQCLAAMNSAAARLLEQEADALAQSSGHHGQGSTWATQEVLRLQSVHERNRAASAALQLLVRIAGAESGATNLRQQLIEIKATLDDLVRLQTAGAEMPVSPPETHAQLHDVEHKLGELDLTLDVLSQQLAMLLGSDLPPGTRFWPDVNLKVDPAMPPLEEAQMIALAQRADLAALRLAARESSRGNLEMMRAVLGQSGAGLGLSAGGCSLLAWLHPRAKNDEAAVRTEQLYTAVADKERSIRSEVAQAVFSLGARLDQIAIAQRRLAFLGDHRESLRRKSEVTPAASFEVRKATPLVLAAQQDVFQDVVEWKTALIRLKEIQGELAIECGYILVVEYANCP
jgi:hypothetical protein